MLEIDGDDLVVEEKGIYSVEKFIIARRLMYWQVYLHKTVLAAEQLLINIWKRAKELSAKGEELFATPALQTFLKKDISKNDLASDENILKHYLLLDDTDVAASVKVWAHHPDKILSWLCRSLVNRNLYNVILQKEPFRDAEISRLKDEAKKQFGVSEQETSYFVFSSSIANNAYSIKNELINILFKDGTITDISKAADQLNISVLSTPVTKNFLCFYREAI